MIMKQTINLICAILFLYGITSCNSCNEKQEVESSKLIVVLYDISGSTTDKTVREAYMENTKTVFSKITHGDIVYAGVISDKSIAELRFPVSHSFPEFDPGTDNPLILKRKQKQANEQIASDKDTILSNIETLLFNDRSTKYTDIFGALHVAARVFNSFPDKKKTLVIMSDMIEDSQAYNFEKENLTDNRIKAIIVKEKGKNRIPSLDSVNVYVTGASAGNNEKFYQVQNFWMEYFHACNAELSKQNYGGALVNFE